MRVIPPSIDVFSPKNQELAPAAVAGILRVVGLGGSGDPAAARFVREDGTSARVDRSATILQEAPLPTATASSRRSRAGTRSRTPSASCTASSSTPPPAATPTCCSSARPWAPSPTTPRARRSWTTSPRPGSRCRRTCADACTSSRCRWTTPRRTARWSTRFSAARTSSCRSRSPRASASPSPRRCGSRAPSWSAAWAASRTRSSTASPASSSPPADLAAFGQALCRLLSEPALAGRLGEAAHERVRLEFLEPRHLTQWVEVLEALPARAAV